MSETGPQRRESQRGRSLAEGVEGPVRETETKVVRVKRHRATPIVKIESLDPWNK